MSKLDEIRARHVIDPKFDTPTSCKACWCDWPCDAAWLIEQVERLRTALRCEYGISTPAKCIEIEPGCDACQAQAALEADDAP